MFHHVLHLVISLVALVNFLLCWSTPADCEGFRIVSQGAAAAGQAGAFAAQADDPSAIYYNPAGMTQLPGIQLYAGALLVGGGTEFKGPGGVKASGTFDGSLALPPPMNFYVTANLKDLGPAWLDDLSAGLGILSRYGLIRRYPGDGPFATAVTFAALPMLDIKPTLAYRLNDKLSVGIGADIYTFADFLGEGQLELKFKWPGGGGLPSGVPVELNGSGTKTGFSVGLLHTPVRNEDGKPVMNVGFQYRSKANLPLKGQFLVNGTRLAKTSATLRLPDVFTGAIAIWPIRDQNHEWKVETDLDYVRWTSFRNLNVRLSNGAVLPFPQNWGNNFVGYGGTEYKWLRPTFLPNWEIAVRGGYWFSQTPVPDKTFNPAISDADNHTLSVGAGVVCHDNGFFLGLFKCGGLGFGAVKSKAIGFDLTYQAVLYEPRRITGNRNPTVNGMYRTTLHTGSIGLRLQF